MKSVSARESTTSLLKRTKVLGKPNPSPTGLTKRASLGGNLMKMEKDNVKSATGNKNFCLVRFIHLFSLKGRAVFTCGLNCHSLNLI